MSNRRCLVVDDEAFVRAFLKAVLRREGFETLESSNGADALAAVQKLNGDVAFVISEIRLDGLDGITLMRSIRKAFPAVPVILMSESVEEPLTEITAKCRFIPKPFSVDALLQTVREVVSAQ